MITREDMIVYWREAAEAAEAKVIEQRQELSNLRMAFESANERLHQNILEIDRLKTELYKRGLK